MKKSKFIVLGAMLISLTSCNESLGGFIKIIFDPIVKNNHQQEINAIYYAMYNDADDLIRYDYEFDSEIKNGDLIIDIISAARGEKTNNNVSLKTPIKELKISLNSDLKDAINKSIKDFKATLFIEELILNDKEEGYIIDNIELNIASITDTIIGIKYGLQ